MGDEHEKKKLINEAKTLRFSLTRKDREFLRAYLGFQQILQIPERIPKKKSDACYFVKRTLWIKKRKKNFEKKNNESKANKRSKGVNLGPVPKKIKVIRMI